MENLLAADVVHLLSDLWLTVVGSAMRLEGQVADALGLKDARFLLLSASIGLFLLSLLTLWSGGLVVLLSSAITAGLTFFVFSSIPDTTDLLWRQFSPEVVDLLIDFEPDFLVFPESRVRIVSCFLAASFALLVFFVGTVLSFVFGSDDKSSSAALLQPKEQSFIQRVRSPRRVYDPKQLDRVAIMVANVPVERTDFTVKSSLGGSLHCSLWCRAGDPTEKCVLYLHRAASSRLEVLRVCRFLLSHRVSVCAFDFTGCGLSEGPSGSGGVQEANDIDAVVKHLKAKCGVTSLVLWGCELGATAALRCQVLRDRNQIRGLVLDSPISDIGALAKATREDDLLTEQQRKSQSLKKAASSVIVPVLLIYSGKNQVLPSSQATRLAKFFEKCEPIVLEEPNAMSTSSIRSYNCFAAISGLIQEALNCKPVDGVVSESPKGQFVVSVNAAECSLLNVKPKEGLELFPFGQSVASLSVPWGAIRRWGAGNEVLLLEVNTPQAVKNLRLWSAQVEEILHHFPKAALGSGDGRSVAASSVPAAAASTSKAQKKKKSKKKTQKKST
mmetsp:Transcript_17821/g.53513  ORF Transcript_17821/g.53513 Transcript_17821/m.53513 type:complete len:557 (-) Transcript_17821:49-1719(-)|eukprot:CAMPEP_0174229476 /NCGR_PEP_ID=MMETSP0417-20130205/447_1 /TAXON_ID=242541 /ORGANISM="Mayorella sp, Strain BSH-02190019" /LENGTH=556 /DNA_ID=CAMNT_0015307029 /DNA_START=140 /DNA_END=1810 /DNA_ORIENTATION=+